MISSNFTEFILLEIVAIMDIVAMAIIQIEIDVNNMELKWIDVKDLFIRHYLKTFKPYFIFTILPILYIVLCVKLFNIKLTEYSTSGFIILTLAVYAGISLKKLVANMKAF